MNQLYGLMMFIGLVGVHVLYVTTMYDIKDGDVVVQVFEEELCHKIYF